MNWRLTHTRSIVTLTNKEGVIWMKVDDVIDWLKNTQEKAAAEESKDLLHLLIKSLIRMKNKKV